ncbi:MAG: hypothetical protein K2N15_09020 [Lachnospiraceae bacterium]|nr:hypothetical protein [Lachnospiraceae bacterium]
MAGAKFAKGSEEWQMFMDYWSLCQKYWEPENNDAYWEEVVKDTDKFYKKHNSDFSRALALVLIDELELKIKKRRMGNE